MNDEQLLGRIVSDPRILAGKPVIKGTRLSVDYILNLLGHGSTLEEVLYFQCTTKRGARPMAMCCKRTPSDGF